MPAVNLGRGEESTTPGCPSRIERGFVSAQVFSSSDYNGGNQLGEGLQLNGDFQRGARCRGERNDPRAISNAADDQFLCSSGHAAQGELSCGVGFSALITPRKLHNGPGNPVANGVANGTGDGNRRALRVDRGVPPRTGHEQCK